MVVVDGLGWEQLQDRRDLAVSMSAMEGVPITTVAPTTTATALTSLATGVPPGEHGVVGYRIAIGRDILNVLRWTTSRGDARDSIDPVSVGLVEPFGSQRPPVVNKAEVEFSGFTEAHLRGTRHVGYRMPSTLNAEVVRLARSGEPFIYAYYDGIDKVAHEYGLGDHYAAELQAIDMMLGALAESLPRGTALVVTADHGQVEVGDRLIRPHPEVLSHTDFQSGEARFRWYHAYPGAAGDLLEAATEHHADVAWVVSRDEVVSEGWLGPKVVPEAMARLGDVAIVAREDVAFEDPADTGPFELISRHGSLTSAEVLVPLLVARS
jgi:predicted AlkP superfamily pyrophosphatase or phosphodiesterase